MTDDIRDEKNPPPRVLSVTALVVKTPTGEVTKEILEFRDAPSSNAVHGLPEIHDIDAGTRDLAARAALRRSA